MRRTVLPLALSRRRFLRRATAAASLGLPLTVWTRLLAQAACDDAPRGELIGSLPLYSPGAEDTPLGTMVGGRGLDARLFTDLSRLDSGRMVTPTPDVFVRTAVPPGLDHTPAAWSIELGTAAGAPARRLTAADLRAMATPMGPHLIECAGNSNPQNFGLMSAAEWDGVALARVLDTLRRPDGATAVLVSGIDDTSQTSRRSHAGASWVLPLATLGSVAPFLATRMNGEALTPHHGAPLRLVVPGWYGCAWIKWVNQIRYVASDEPATSQMIEFAGRTHQDGRPALARDYAPPEIDTAAMPIRIEQRRVDGALEYRVVGIVWGGRAVVERLVIRFGSRDAGTPVRVCAVPQAPHTWALWTHRWRPTEPGYYDITLKTADAAVRTRRLDVSFYIRRVKIDEI